MGEADRTSAGIGPVATISGFVRLGVRMGSEANETLDPLRNVVAKLRADGSFSAVAEALCAGHAATIDGAWGSARSLALAALADATSDMLFVLVPHPSQIEPLVNDLSAMTAGRPMVLPALEEAGRRAGTRSVLNRESYGRRLRVLSAIQGPDRPRILVSSIAGVLQGLPSLDTVSRSRRTLRQGTTIHLTELTRWLMSQGWRRRDAVEVPGEFSMRGGILDLYPADADYPLRIELFGDEIESIREFSIETQRSVRSLTEANLLALVTYAEDEDRVGETSRPAVEESLDVLSDDAHLADLLPPGTWVALVEPQEIQSEGNQYLNRLEDASLMFRVEDTWRRLVQRPSVAVTSLPYASAEVTCSLAVETVERFSGDVHRVRGEIDRTAGEETVIICCHNAGEVQRLREILGETRVAQEGRLKLQVGSLADGFRWISGKVVALSDDELFHREGARRPIARRRFQSKAIDSFVELSPGDFVVHLAHGIGNYRGMKMLEKNDQFEEHLILEFADGVLIYVPVTKMDLVQKYIGSGQSAPRLSKIGGQIWERRKKQAQLAVRDLAVDLIDVQASRQSLPGISFPPDSVWQQEFEAAFAYEETPDQWTSIKEIKEDMLAAKPMDRLLCGDVGYGKTELAMRAAFKAIDFGKQVAVLVPTTVLAQQHLRTFRARMAEFPYTIEAITRFESRKDQKRILSGAETGSVDVLIGTHRLLSEDVKFHDLGLIVVDEEQRFGVAHKERLKRLRSQVDVLTMTATPIPRTLHSALLGIRDISNLETPPENRLAVETRLVRWNPEVIRHAIVRELNRDGQVYFVHNRIQDIGAVAKKIEHIVPEARIAIIHGQMTEDLIEDRLVGFLERRFDILLATTIIESGLDIPNANTIFIDEGEKYGLADLHQLRGRVGRSKNRAYCYVIIDEARLLKPEAQRRLKAIEEYSQLGAGFQIALRDLEIRGAGNILGSEQSGHIAAIGYELYCQLLENAVRAAKKLPVRSFLDVTIELPWSAYLPHDYVAGERFRIDAYRRLARIESLDGLTEFRDELRDRFGPLPEPAENMIDLAELRLLAQIWQIDNIRPDDQGNLLLAYRHSRRLATLEKLRERQIFAIDPRTAYIRVLPSERTARGYAAVLKRVLQPS